MTKDFYAICNALYDSLRNTGLSGRELETEFNEIMQRDYALYFRGNREDSLFADVEQLTMDMVRDVMNKYFSIDARLMEQFGEEKFWNLRNRGLI